jgi:glycosyltransferase involved in cell wall biosynthesis
VRRIKVVYYSDARCYGGAEYYLQVLALHLPRERFEVGMILRPLEGVEKLRRPLVEAGIPVFEPPEPERFRPAHWTAVYRHLRRGRADILHVNLPGPYDGRAGTIAAVGRLAGARVVTTEHLPMWRGPWKRRLAKYLTRGFADAVVTVSDSNVECLERIHGIGRDRVRRIYNGIDLDTYVPGRDRAATRAGLGLADGERAVGIVGRLEFQKGHSYFLDAASQVHRTHPEARFLIVGEGNLRGALERKIRETGLGEVVRFLGYRTDIPQLLDALDVVVFASICEGMPFALLEALAMEKAVVASDVLGLQEVIRSGDTGRLVTPRSGDAIAEALEDLLRRPEEAASLGRRGRRAVEERFRREDMILRTAAVYEGLVA